MHRATVNTVKIINPRIENNLKRIHPHFCYNYTIKNKFGKYYLVLLLSTSSFVTVGESPLMANGLAK